MTELTTFCIVFGDSSFEMRKKAMEHFPTKIKIQTSGTQKMNLRPLFFKPFSCNLVFLIIDPEHHGQSWRFIHRASEWIFTIGQH